MNYSLPAPVQRRLAEEEEQWLKSLSQLISIPSVSARNESLDRAARFVMELGVSTGLEASLLEMDGAAPLVILKGGRGRRRLMYYNHYDVQPVEPLEKWDSPPFRLSQRDGVLIGRGVADNKGDLVARLAAVSAWRGMGGLPCQVIFLVEGEEEIGSINLERYMQDHSDRVSADGCVWEAGGRDSEGRLELSFGVKGCLYVELTVRTAEHDLHSSWATLAPNAVWRLCSALSTLVDGSGLPAVDGFLENVQPPGTHDLSAAREMSISEEAMCRQLGVNRLIPGDGPPLIRHLFNSTVNIAGIGAGYQGAGSKTVLPSQAVAKMDFRLVPGQTWRKTRDLLRAHLDRRGFDDIEMDILGVADPYRASMDSDLSQAAVLVGSAIYGSDPKLIPSLAGTGPMAQVVGELDIPCFAAGVGHEGSQVHALNENIRLTDWRLGTHFQAALLGKWGI